HPVLGPGSINVGTIAGGKQPNIVPDACSLWADRRLLPGESYVTIASHLLKELKARGVRVQIHYRRDAECPALETDLQLPWVKALMRQQRQRKALGVDYFCDAAVIASAGTPCVVMGPGSIDQAHTVDEWISLASLEAGRQSLRQFMSQLP
ncbi:MAG: M20/M25/M40 family metallo-hydrolase, partial [Verrucomicrobiota bacterium]|nr:M20/M25/M40 family metallo-hydrolase [Verrucomicrobiota bacterium]